MMHVPRSQLFAALVGAAVPLSAIAAFAVRRAFQPAPQPTTPITVWTVAEVGHWLRQIGAHKQTIHALKSQGINGAILCALTLTDLHSMGVSARDARLIVAAREDYLQDATHPRAALAVAPPLPSHLSMRSLGSTTAASPQSHGVRLFMRSAEDLLAAANTATYDAEDEEAHRTQTARQLYALLDVFRELSLPDQTAAMDPLGRQLLAIATMPTPRARVSMVPTDRAASVASTTLQQTPLAHPRGFSAETVTQVRPRQTLYDARHTAAAAQAEAEAEERAEAETAEAAAAVMAEMAARRQREEVGAKLAPLDAMIDNFLRLLSSDEFARVPAAELSTIASRVEAQIQRIKAVAMQVSAPEADALQHKCDMALQVIAQAKARPAVPQQQPLNEERAPRGDGDEDDEKVGTLMKRLEAVFQVAKDPTILSLPPAQRLQLVQTLKAEVTDVQADAAQLRDDCREVLLQVSSRVASLLDEMNGLSQNEADAAARSPAKSNTGPSQVVLVSNALREILQVLQSPEFNAAPAQIKAQLSDRLVSRIGDLRKVCAQLSPAEREPLFEVMDGVTSLLTSPPQQAAAANAVSQRALAPPEDGAPAATGANAVNRSDTDNADKEKAELPLDIIVEQLERIVTFLNSNRFRESSEALKGPIKGLLLPVVEVLRSLQSDSFNDAPESEKLRYITKVCRSLEESMTCAASIPAPLGSTVVELVRDTIGILEAQADDLRERGVEAAVTRRASTQADALDGIIEQAGNLFSFVTSETFEKAEPAAKRRISLDAIPRVQELQRAARDLVGPKHLILSEVLIPLEALLTKVAEDSAGAPNGGAATGDEEEEAVAQATSTTFRDIMSALNDVDDVLDSPKLQEANNDRRQRLARAVIAQLQRITSLFAGLPEAEREAAQKRVAPIHAKLVALVRGDGGAEETAHSESKDGQTPDGSMSAEMILQELKQVMAVLQDERLFTGDSSTIAARVAVLKGAEERLELLLQESADKPETFRTTVVPVVTRMRHQIDQLLQIIIAMSQGSTDGSQAMEGDADADGARELPQEQDAAEQDEDETETEARGRSAIYDRIAEITEELRCGRAQGMTMGPAELEPLVSLWRTVAAIEAASDEEKQIGAAFLDELKAQIESGAGAAATTSRTVPLSAGGEDAEEEADGEVKDDDGEGGEGEDGKASMQTFMRTLNYIRTTLANRRLDAPSDLIPFMAMAERTLTKADQDGVNWRANAEAAKLVRRTLSTIQELQAALVQRAASDSPDKARSGDAGDTPSAPAATSQLTAQLSAAVRTIGANPPETPEELGVYLEVLEDVENTQDDVTMNDLRLVKALQEAILEAGRRLGGNLDDEEEAEKSEEGEEDEETGESANDAVPSQAAVEGRVSEILLRISDQLREGLLPEEILGQYDDIVSAVQRSITNPCYSEAMDAIKEQIHLQRVEHANGAQTAGADQGEDDVAVEEDTAESSSPEDVEEEDRQVSDAIMREVPQPAVPQTQAPSEGIFREKDEEEDDGPAES